MQQSNELESIKDSNDKTDEHQEPESAITGKKPISATVVSSWDIGVTEEGTQST